MPRTAPPDHLLWRDATEWSIPPTEGSRDLLVWTGFTVRIYTPQYGVGWGVGHCSACEHLLGMLLPGDKPPGLWWTWADGDPWTHRSPADREDEKLIFHARGYSATTETIQGILNEDPAGRQLALPILGAGR